MLVGNSASKLRDFLMVEASKLSKKNYTELRNCRHKWGVVRLGAEQVQSLKLDDCEAANFLSVNLGKHVDTYPVKSLKARMELKRNFDFFASIYLLWLEINPFHLKGISSIVWVKVNEFLYTHISGIDETSLAKSMAVADTDEDFLSNSALCFSGFYDSLFNYVDCNCRSKLASEYVRLVKRIKSEFVQSRCLEHVSLYSKKHIPAVPQATYAPWMLAYLKEIKRPVNPPPPLAEQLSSPRDKSRPATTISKRFQQRITSPKAKRIRSGKQLISLQLERHKTEPCDFKSSYSRTFITSPTSASTRNIRTTLQSYRRSYRPEYLDILSPLANHRSDMRKETGILEEVIKSRIKQVDLVSFTS